MIAFCNSLPARMTLKRPSDRGLQQKPGSRVWYFPPDYETTLKALVDESLARGE